MPRRVEREAIDRAAVHSKPSAIVGASSARTPRSRSATPGCSGGAATRSRATFARSPSASTRPAARPPSGGIVCSGPTGAARRSPCSEGPASGARKGARVTKRAWFIGVATAVLLAPTGVPVAADTIPDLTVLRERVRASGGPIADSWREIDETVSSDGTTTIEHDYRRGKDFRYTFDTGPFHTERGLSGGRRWHMNDNGQVIVDQPDPGQATREVTTTTVAAIHTPVEGFVIATLNAQGRGDKEYIDGATFRVVRREQVTTNGTIVSTLDDVRPEGGRTFAHHVHIQNGYADTTSDLRVTAYAPDDVPESDVAIPKARRALVTFPPGVGAVDLPTNFGRSHIYVRVFIGGRGLDFVLDSGAGQITIDSDVARELGLKEYGKHSAVTAARYT